MTYRSEGVVRHCVMCEKEIAKDDWMMDFFRLRGGSIEWAHEKCVRLAMEAWIEKKRARLSTGLMNATEGKVTST